MSEILTTLREKNPNLTLYSVLDPEFAPYGRVITGADCTALRAALLQTPIPEQGNMYVASEPVLEATELTAWLREGVFGGTDIQMGFCNGRGFTLNSLEYHKCGEVNYSATGCVLLMALQRDVKNGRLDSRDVVGFWLPADVLVEVRAEVFHFAPCRVTEDGFNCLVVLARGTNAEFAQPITVKTGEAAMLWRVGKWMISHPDSPQAKLGSYVGIDGENLQLKI